MEASVVGGWENVCLYVSLMKAEWGFEVGRRLVGAYVSYTRQEELGRKL